MPFITASIPGDNKAILIHVPSAGIYLLKSKSSAFISLVPYFALHILCEVLNQGELHPFFLLLRVFTLPRLIRISQKGFAATGQILD